MLYEAGFAEDGRVSTRSALCFGMMEQRRPRLLSQRPQARGHETKSAMHTESKNPVPSNKQENDLYLSLAGKAANGRTRLVGYLFLVLIGEDIAVQDDQSRSNEFLDDRRRFSTNKMAVEFLEGRV